MDAEPCTYRLEVHYIDDWDKGIKFLADAGVFEDMSVILTGSDSTILKVSMKRLAGRRGKAERPASSSIRFPFVSTSNWPVPNSRNPAP